jgi:hypothetical protein
MSRINTLPLISSLIINIEANDIQLEPFTIQDVTITTSEHLFTSTFKRERIDLSCIVSRTNDHLYYLYQLTRLG